MNKLNIETKVSNQGATPAGRLTALEFNSVCEKINELITYVGNLDPDGKGAISVVQETGSSTENVMSQKAVTELYNGLQAIVNTLKDKGVTSDDLKSWVVDEIPDNDTSGAWSHEKPLSEAITAYMVYFLAAQLESKMGSDLVVQNTGTSTTAVMSQNAITDLLANINTDVNGHFDLLEWLAGIAGCVYGSFSDGDVVFDHKWVTYSGRHIWVLMWSYSDDGGMVAYKNNATTETEADRLESFDFAGGGNDSFTHFEGRLVPSEFGEMRAQGDIYVWVAQEDFISSNLYALLQTKADTTSLSSYATTEYVNNLVGDVETLLNAL